MNIPFSSSLPDAVQKALGLAGGAGTVKEAIVGVLVVVTAVWALLKGMIWLRKRNGP